MPTVNSPGKPEAPPRIESNRFITPDGSILPMASWIPSDSPVKAVIIALHGFNDYSGFFNKPGQYFTKLGIASYSYDQRGFGNAPCRGFWSGTSAYTDDLGSFVKAVRHRHQGVPLYLLGESMGGAVTIVAMTSLSPPAVDGVILTAPAVWGRDTMPWYQRWLLTIGTYSTPWIKVSANGLGITPTDNIEERIALKLDPLIIKKTRIDTLYGLSDLMGTALAGSKKLKIPTLVLYGRKDQIIPTGPIMEMLDNTGRNVRGVFYENGYHLLLRDREAWKPLADIAAWIGNHERPLPYGKENLH